MNVTTSMRIHVEELLPVAVTRAAPTSHDLFTSQTSRDVLVPRREAHASPNLERDQVFSWSRCFFSLISYGLLLSDVLRTGLGLHGVSSSHGLRAVEPDTLLFLKQTSYSVQHLTPSNATMSSSMAYWLYKYDTTSISMRAFAEHLNVAAWSPCVLYKQTCDESGGLTMHSVFRMIDSLVEAVSNHKPRQPGARPFSATRPRAHLTLRTESIYKDRLHHYAFSFFFARNAKVTNQAIHYPYHGSTGHGSASLCAANHPTQPRPYSCGESWTKWKEHQNYSTFSVWEAIPKRLDMLATLYPNHTIDSIVLDGAEDFARGGITCQGRKYLEVVVFTRIRACDNFNGSSCTTVAVDDYRYEAAALVMNADSWYGVVATLRVVGQTYTWLRVLLLVVICTLARSQQRKTRTLLQEMTMTLRTLFLIPSQVVIYGSSVPIALYMFAHLIDSPAIYELVSMRFVSTLGKFRWNASDFIRHCAVSMRTAWILSIICHLLLAASTRCVWSPSQGIPGVPEMLISLVASLTILAQFRSLNLRDARLLHIYEVVPSRRMQQVRGHIQDGTRGTLSKLFFGSTVDSQCLMSAVLALCGLAWLLWLVHRVSQKHFPYQVALFSRTIVPYSAGALWPKNRLVVSWFGSILERVDLNNEPFTRTASHAPGIQLMAFPRFGNASVRISHEVRAAQEKALVIRDTDASRQAQRAIQNLEKRSREIESAIFLVNLAVMTDPISFVQLRFFSGCQVAVYESKLTQRSFLLPHGLHRSAADIPVDWDELELRAIVNTKDLDWCDLLRCG